MWNFDRSMMGTLSRNWWMLLVAGLAAVLFGILTLAYPLQTLGFLVAFYGAYALVDGVFTIIAAINQGEHKQPWGFLLFSGIVSILAGLITFFYPGLTAIVLYVIIAAWALLRGGFEIAAAIQLRRVMPHDWVLGLTGVLSILFGALLFAYPASGLLTIAWLIGLYAILYGCLEIALSVRMHHFSQLATPAV